MDWPPVAPLPAPVIPAKKRAAPEEKKEEEDEDSLCMVCLAEQADTIAMPCGCVVACHACSPKLAATPDKRTCLRCRRAITSVVYPDRDVAI